MGKFATKQELIYVGIATLVFIGLVFILVTILPLKTMEQIQADENKQTPSADNNSTISISPGQEDIAKTECIKLCELYKGTTSYANGPCLSDMWGFKIEDWVCDIAHKPRLDVDNKEKNQCKAFKNGVANHFVEVDENCGFIRLY